MSEGGPPVLAPTKLLLALGNDLLGDDGIGPLIARVVAAQVGPEVEVVESGEAGLALLELLIGYEGAVIVDAIQTAEHPVGTVLVFGRDDFRRVVGPSAHYAGLPEVFDLAERLNLSMPRDLWVVAVEVANPFDFAETPCAEVRAAIPAAAARVRELLGE
ncbi:MAG: hydrogenase maturation protease [Fimbriimonadaceae bacterium]|nr:hydrogenase maturation protease [Fimbriimonadaceae bacterium]